MNPDREYALDSLSRKLGNVLLEDEEISEEEECAVAEAIEWLKHNKPIPLEDVLSDFGLTMADWETMGKTPPPGEDGAGKGLGRMTDRERPDLDSCGGGP